MVTHKEVMKNKRGFDNSEDDFEKEEKSYEEKEREITKSFNEIISGLPLIL